MISSADLRSPNSPEQMDWSEYYPDFVDSEETTLDGQRPRQLKKDVEIVDIGCGFGGLTVALATKLPETLILGRCGLG